jgi:hypothetical protein
MILSKDYNFGGGNMDGLTIISIFFGGLGIFFIGGGILWAVSIWSKQTFFGRFCLTTRPESPYDKIR